MIQQQQGSSFYNQKSQNGERKPNFAMTSELVLGNKKANEQKLELPAQFMNNDFGTSGGLKKSLQGKFHMQGDYLQEQNGNIRKPLISDRDIDKQTKKLAYEIDELDKQLLSNKNTINDKELDNLKLDTANIGAKVSLPPRIRCQNPKNSEDSKVQLVIPDFIEKPTIKVQKNDNQENKKPKQQLILRDNYDQNLDFNKPKFEQVERNNNFQQKPMLPQNKNQQEPLPNWLKMDVDDDKPKISANQQQQQPSFTQQQQFNKPSHNTEAYVPNYQNTKSLKSERQQSRGKKTNHVDQKIAVATGVQEVPKIEVDDNEKLILCPEGCGRSFNEKALEKHIPICKKIFQDKRSEFNTQKQRIIDTEQAKLLRQAKMKDKKEKKNIKVPDNKQKTAKNWKEESEQLRKIIKQKQQK